MSRPLVTFSLASGVVFIGIADYLTGPDVGFSLFYLAPIVWSAWHIDRATSLALAVLASCFWLGAEIAWHGVNAISLWNGFTRIGIYLGMAWLTSRLRAEQQQLHEINGKLQAMLHHEQLLARTDSLTTLPNRRLFVDELKRATARSHRMNAPLAVAYLDLDSFKLFNDRHGRLAGDAVLRSIADVLATYTAANSVAARLGGDEFGLLLEQCTEAAADSIARRLFQELITVVGSLTKDTVGINIGVACFERPPLSPDAVIDHADAAMFCAKAKGHNGIYVTNIVAEPVLTHTSQL
ncbi:MAG: GGDEF domain-containing protein [Planctomycetaceae bacterium]|nr:GGDEF domain-containing protein [Planctomycetaceae bacterium]